MGKMEFTYTSGWEEFEQYCKELYRGYLNRYCQGNEKGCEDEINKAYAIGMSFIREKVKENKEILKQLWVAAFIGNLARKYDLTVTVRTQSCAFILGLFNLLPYDVMKKTSINYPFANISLTEYEVGELFYNTAKREIEAFFHDSRHEILWLGSVEKDEIQSIGIAVLPEGKTKLDYIKNCVKLTDGSIGLIEETTSAYNETEESIAEIYYFRPTKRTTKLDMDICEGLKIDKTENFVCSWENMIETGFMTPEEEVRFQYIKPDTEFEMMEILAFCRADVNYPELEDENILFSVYPFTREDVFGYLINISMSEKNACYWTEVIRKGQFADKYEKGNDKDEANYFDDSEVEMFKAVKYLPSEISVSTTYELYKRCAVQNKIAQIRDLERQKEWFGYSCN
ncbi:unknown [Dorea sp. CAG:317]|nr:unknown [Dorea sp. CAG:317]